jgi:fluoroquinolone transport system permease protein
MRFLNVLKADIAFQYRYGFYFVYGLFTLVYSTVLQLLPEAWKVRAAMIMIYSDPAILGLFFMGAIVQFEKDEHTLHSLAVSPLNVEEYVLSKLCSLSCIAVLVALGIAGFGTIIENPLRIGSAVFIGSCLFSAIGLVVATRAQTLNRFILATIPWLLVITLPAFVYIVRPDSVWMLLHPGICLIEICLFGNHLLTATISLLFWTVVVVWFSIRATKVFFSTLGGGS